jgi:hypothetical protein
MLQSKKLKQQKKAAGPLRNNQRVFVKHNQTFDQEFVNDEDDLPGACKERRVRYTKLGTYAQREPTVQQELRLRPPMMTVRNYNTDGYFKIPTKLKQDG